MRMHLVRGDRKQSQFSGGYWRSFEFVRGQFFGKQSQFVFLTAENAEFAERRGVKGRDS